MSKEQIFSIIRHVLSVIAGILVAKGVVAEGVALELSGSLMGLSAVVWSIFDKTITINKVEAGLRHLLTVLGAFWTVFTPALSEQIISGIVAAIPFILGQTDKLKNVPATEPVEETTE